MREILFRGKRVDTGEWVEGDLVHGVADQEGLLFIWAETEQSPTGMFEFNVIPESVGQFVGKFVTTGEKCTLEWARIFEGDILSCVVPEWPEGSVEYRSLVEYAIRKGVVAYQKDLGEFRIRFFKNGEYWKRENLWTYGIKRLDVIGNVYDNPELLEAK